MRRKHSRVRIIKLRHNGAKWHRPRVRVAGGRFFHGKRSRFFGSGPVKVNRRRRFRRLRLNPFNVKGAIRQVTNKRWLIGTAMIGGGIAAGMLTKSVSSMILAKAGQSKFDKYSGVLSVVIGALLIGMMKKKAVKEIGAIVAGAGLYDLVAQNVPMLRLPALPTIAVPMLPQPQASSYQASVQPVSNVARRGIAASYASPAGVAASYASRLPQAGFQGMDSPYAGIEGWDN